MIKRDKERKARFDAKRPSAAQRGYNGKWQEASKAFLAANPYCAYPNCRQPATVVDHIKPHRGDMRVFWAKSNWQPMCAHHHNSAKQRMECQ